MVKLIRNKVDSEYIIGKLYVLRKKKREGLLSYFTPIKYDIVFECVTLERPWKDNKPYISCIPPKPGDKAKYKLDVLEKSPAFDYPHLELLNVPNRTFIKVHIANFVNELHGCIAVGKEYKDGMITDSRNTMEELMNYRQDFDKIEITYS